MTEKAARVLAVLLCILIAMGGVQGATLTVAPDGGAYTDLHQALDAAAPGDEIVVRAGTYPGGVVIGVPVTVSGEEGATIGTAGDTTALSVTADDVIIRNLACTAAGVGIIANQTDGLVVRDCRVISDGVGILCSRCNESTLATTQVMAAQTGIETMFCMGTKISGCQVTADGIGITLRDTEDTALEGVHLMGAELGILAENAERCEITNTTFTGNGAGILGVGITDCSITGSAFSDVIQYIQFYAASGCSVETPSLEGPTYFAADIFSNTTYCCDPYTVSGRDFGLLADTYTPPEGYQLFGDAMNITFISAAESAEAPSVTIEADIPAELPGIAGNTYGIYRTDGTEPVLMAVPDVSEEGSQILQMTVTEPAHIALMARTEADETPYYYIFLWAVVALGVLLLLVLWRKR
ncbi:right-handed parallel beta-helix repeat-containing protein [Methanogenium organophilum]|uniref:Periplasmic copper-binding protein NosD beta helix domain-containing protein n=1 Tax=Methanogenium organophilum TaxID=2199 RepID=A0A9X9S2J7_METOG|nr:NosD domain-containing protein [Methanogenium organophilum]WAI00617.1 hypothetical protein OU421_09290 [Methanogenium organophilum]